MFFVGASMGTEQLAPPVASRHEYPLWACVTRHMSHRCLPVVGARVRSGLQGAGQHGMTLACRVCGIVLAGTAFGHLAVRVAAAGERFSSMRV